MTVSKMGSELDGLNGIVYLLCLGGETYPGVFEDAIMKPLLVKNKASIYQSTKRLANRGFLQVVREELEKPGKPKILRAKDAAIFEALRMVSVSPSPAQEEVLRTLIQKVSPAIMARASRIPVEDRDSIFQSILGGRPDFVEYLWMLPYALTSDAFLFQLIKSWMRFLVGRTMSPSSVEGQRE